MASSMITDPPLSPRTIDDLLICPVCLESFKDPKTLACLHSFCSPCLESCKRPYRREIVCPVCKKVTQLSTQGVQGLQNDFRIQQIRDILQGQCSPTRQPAEDSFSSAEKQCDVCKVQQRRMSAENHCVQCAMYFCAACLGKHEGNELFVNHHVINMNADNAVDTMFCKHHKEYPIRYFCKPCAAMLCTICTMSHDATHKPVNLDRNMISKYQKDLHATLKTISAKLNEVKSRTKYLETIKQTYQQALYEAQSAIKDRTNEVVEKLRQQEKSLLDEVSRRYETKMKHTGLDNLCEMNFHKINITNLHQDVQTVITGSPQQCLVAYEDLIGRMHAVAETTLPTLIAHKENSIVRFVPAEENLNIILGQLKECTLSEAPATDSRPQSPICPSSPTSTTSPTRHGFPNRVSSILNALSSSRKNEVKIGKVKAFSSQGDRSKSSTSINADDLIGSTSNEQEEPVPSTSTAVTLDTPPSSPSDETRQIKTKPNLVYKVDQIGGWPGKILSPSGVGFLPDGSIVVAEGENRLQVFDRNGQSLRIIGWGKIKPQGVAVTRDGKIVITDKKDKCVKVFHADGEMRTSWGAGLFGLPAGIAASPSGNIIVTDVDKHVISVHAPDGTLLTNFGSWGCGDYQFNSPAFVTVNKDDQIIVSDSCNGCVKIFDKVGKFVRRFSITNHQGNPNSIRRPQGVAVDGSGNIIVADRDNHRVSMFTNEGQFVRHILTRHDGVKYPCDVQMNEEGHVVVVESHSGFLTKEPHHAVKVYQIYN